jgi:hypothetical protein
MPEMDAIDRQQQVEIKELQAVNQRQDSFMRNLLWAFVLFALIQFFGMIMFLSKSGEPCPHEGCPHHIHAQ